MYTSTFFSDVMKCKKMQIKFLPNRYLKTGIEEHAELMSGLGFTAHWLSYFSSAVNSIIYNFMSDEACFAPRVRSGMNTVRNQSFNSLRYNTQVDHSEDSTKRMNIEYEYMLNDASHTKHVIGGDLFIIFEPGYCETAPDDLNHETITPPWNYEKI
ncbi:hypothetical protein HELRODRAFT_171271 [Helobdella robusta]|uniref:Uncharacterized protein n=1 Tax=Helobdella robusta TaxID=6412 RepID=T1F404_HELRO|nr:hypothetical protein HELRODRAFT_171271 [Helobdella robusta]ESO05617.1 hypothetical protein HELRODRAFT_171271 [Helobdella robusta]